MLEKGLMILLILLIIPELVGLFILRFFKKENTNLILAFIVGYLTEFAVCQLIAVPYIYLEKTLTELINVLAIIFGSISVLSIVINLTNVKNIVISCFNYIKKMPKLLSILVVILIGLQVYSFVGYMHIDDPQQRLLSYFQGSELSQEQGRQDQGDSARGERPSRFARQELHRPHEERWQGCVRDPSPAGQRGGDRDRRLEKLRG